MRIIVAATLATLLGTACSKPTDPTTAPYWMARLEDRQERNEALVQLGKIGDKQALPAVLEWFQKEGVWQPAAAYALGQLGDPSVVPVLVKSLSPDVGTGRDRGTNIKNRININAARALAMLHAKEAAPDLLKLLRVPDNGTREAVIGALGALGNPVAVEPLIKIADGESDPFVRKAAIEALGELNDASAVPVLVRMLFDEPGGVSFYASAKLALVELGSLATPALIDTLRGENKEVAALRMANGDPLPEGLVEAKAASTLAAMRAEKARGLVGETLDRFGTKLKRAGDKAGMLKPVVVELIYSVGQLGGPAAAKALMPLLREGDADVRLAATEALTTAGDAAAVPALLQAARAGAPEARLAAIVAVSRLGNGSQLGAFDALGADAKDETGKLLAQAVQAERVRLVAAEACKTDAACWRGKLSDPNGKVRERAAFELGWMGAKDALPDLIKLAEDTDPEVRMAAVLSIGRLGGADPDKLQAIHDAWEGKVAYAGANAELRTTIARLRQAKAAKK